MRLTPRKFIWLLRRSIFAAFDDGCLGIAKGAAYSALLSFFPVLASAATVLVQTRAGFVSRFLENTLDQIVPPGSEDLVMQQFRVTGARPIWLLIAAFVISIWAASGVIKSLMEGFQAIYRIPRNRSFLRTQQVAIAMVLLAAFPLVCATALVIFGGQVESTVLAWMKVDPILSPLSPLIRAASRGASYLLAFLTIVTVTSTLYWFGPYRRQRWRFVWPGATLATVFWLLATTGFAWYVRNIGHYNVMYGSIGAGIALLVWMYLIAVIALIGCAFNAEYERASVSREEPRQTL
ncbi:MAG TPA: YihY/virulence factor BrkB family protein [Bryobacteraceae bacterium]|nr:YihY/virulence factor BrkB family protein [Bryobacteraceae bacterium]